MRSPLLALIKKDVRGYFDQPAAYILIVPFVAVLSWVYFSSVSVIAEASLRPLFTVDFTIERPSLPWLLALFVPAATMRLIAEENRDGTLEMILTHPIRGWIVLLSKFAAGFIFVAFAIFATLGIPVAVQFAGDLDVGAAAGQYLGVLFLAASFVAIGLFTSSLTRNQIVSFILGLSVTMLLMIMGLDIVAVTLPSRLATLLQDLSPITHFSSIARGVIHLRDVLYFIALVSTFLSATFLMLRARTLSHRSPQYRNLQLGVAGLMVVSLLVGWSSTAIGGRVDLTEDKLFTMSSATEDILNQLEDIMTVELFQSKDPPVQVSLVARDVRDFLVDFTASSGGKIKLIHRYPDGDENDARKSQLAGIPPVQFNIQSQGELQIKTGFLGVALTYLDQREVIPFVSSVDGFEYRIASLANKMVSQKKQTVGFLTGHGEMTASTGYTSFARLLSDAYKVTEIEAPENGAPDLSNVDVLIVGGPKTHIPEQVVNALRSYIDTGGKVMFMIDSVLVDQSNLVAQSNTNSFAHFVEDYGVIVEDDLVFDIESNETLSFGTQMGDVFLPYPFWIRVRVTDTKVAGNMESALLPWASSLGVVEESRDRIEAITLLETSSFAAIDFEYGDLRPNAPIFSQITRDNQLESQMAVAISQLAEQSVSDSPYRLVVIGTSGWLSDQIIGRAEENVALGLNLVDWLAQEDMLAAVRSKVVSTRTLLYSSNFQENISRWGNVAGVPLVLVVLGLMRSVRRRRFGFTRYGQAHTSRLVTGRGRKGGSGRDDGGGRN